MFDLTGFQNVNLVHAPKFIKRSSVCIKDEYMHCPFLILYSEVSNTALILHCLYNLNFIEKIKNMQNLSAFVMLYMYT